MNYWNECISEAFEDAGINATDDQIYTVADWVEGAHENFSMAHGYDAIPNPMISEVDKLKKRIKELEDHHNMQLDGIRKGVARRRNVNMHDVYIDDQGHVTYNVQ